jgi:hypothetical protein
MTFLSLHPRALAALMARLPRGMEHDGMAAGTLHLHLLEPVPFEDLETLAESLALHLPDGVAVMAGECLIGTTWLGVCQIAAADHRIVDAADAAERAVDRAVDLTGARCTVESAPLFTTHELRDAYRRRAGVDVGTWGIDVLLLGCLVEMTLMPLEDVVEHAERDAPEVEGPEDLVARDRHRAGRLTDMLEAWARDDD